MHGTPNAFYRLYDDQPDRRDRVLELASLVYISLDEDETTLQILEEMVEPDASYRTFVVEEPDLKVLRGNDRYEHLINP